MRGRRRLSRGYTAPVGGGLSQARGKRWFSNWPTHLPAASSLRRRGLGCTFPLPPFEPPLTLGLLQSLQGLTPEQPTRAGLGGEGAGSK